MRTARAVRAVFTEAGAVLQNTENGATFSVNQVGANIWRQLAKGASRDEIVVQVGLEFAVTNDDISRDLDEFLTSLEQKGLLSELTDNS